MAKVDLNQLAEDGNVDALEEERDFVRSMYRSGDITHTEYASELAKLELLIGQANDNQDSNITTG